MPQNPTTIKNPSAHGLTVRIPAPPFERCPKCGEMNNENGGNLWRVADNFGTYLDCTVCATCTPTPATKAFIAPRT